MKISARQYAQTLFDLVEKADQNTIPGIIMRFVGEMKKNGHMTLGKQVIEQFDMIYNAKNHITKAHVTTAHSIDDTQKNRIESYIKRVYDAKQVDATYSTDKKIIGGMIIKVHDEILDASVRRRMNVLSQRLINGS